MSLIDELKFQKVKEFKPNYLTKIKKQKFFLDKAFFDEAFNRFMEANKGTRLGKEKFKDLNDLFIQCGMVVKFDKYGNANGIKSKHGDISPYFILKTFPNLVKEDSFFILMDFSKKFWKVTFEKGEINYYIAK